MSLATAFASTGPAALAQGLPLAGPVVFLVEAEGILPDATPGRASWRVARPVFLLGAAA